MLQFIRANLFLALAVTLLTGTAAAGVLAAAGSGGPSAQVAGEGEGTPTETVEPTETLEPTETPEATPEGVDGELSVPQDSPACANVGCGWVETPDGEMKYLPLPAVRGIECAKAHREAAQTGEPLDPEACEEHGNGAPDGVPNGSPDGVGPPDFAPSDEGEDDGDGPPVGVPRGRPDGAGPPDFAPGNDD